MLPKQANDSRAEMETLSVDLEQAIYLFTHCD